MKYQFIISIIKFLTIAYEKGAQYGTLNSYRSALTLINIVKISENNDLKDFSKGCFVLVPRYLNITKLGMFPLFYILFGKMLSKWRSRIRKALLVPIGSKPYQKLESCRNITVRNKNKNTRLVPDLIKTSRVDSSQPLRIIPFLKNVQEYVLVKLCWLTLI